MLYQNTISQMYGQLYVLLTIIRTSLVFPKAASCTSFSWVRTYQLYLLDSQSLINAIQSSSTDASNVRRMRRQDHPGMDPRPLWKSSQRIVGWMFKASNNNGRYFSRPVSFTTAYALIHRTLKIPPPSYCRTKAVTTPPWPSRITHMV